jgi:hypothetical protein
MDLATSSSRPVTDGAITLESQVIFLGTNPFRRPRP